MSSSLAGLSLNNRYRLLDRIAAGSSTDVWDAYDDRLSRPVAIKITRSPALVDSDVVKAFRDEAAIAAKFNHRNIVETFDAGIDILDEKPTAFIVMERVYGKTLREALRSHPFSESEIRRIGEQICDAAEYLHSLGIFHTDIKPTNILVTGNPAYADTRVVLTDFGLASSTSSPRQSVRGGTAAYIAPELIEGKVPDAQSDIYSIGTVLYELAADSPPILEESEEATLQAKLNRAALPVRTLRPDLSVELAQTIDTCVTRNPEDRFKSARELRNILTDRSQPEPSGPILKVDNNAPTPPYGTHKRPVLSRRSRKPLAIFSFFSIFAIAIAVAVARFGGLSSLTGQTRQNALTQIGVNTIRSFDPLGDQQENDAELPNLDDNNPSTVWSTSHYNSHLFGGLKSGVGVTFDFNPARVSRVVISGATQNATLEIFTAAQPQAKLADWGKPVAQSTITSDQMTVDFPAVQAGAVLIWITDLGPDNKFSAGEVQIFG